MLLLSNFTSSSSAWDSCIQTYDVQTYNIFPLLAGMMLSYLKGAYISWRTAAWTSVIYVVIPLLLISIWIPESPVWLVARGRVEEAEESLKWLSGDKVRLSMCISVSILCWLPRRCRVDQTQNSHIAQWREGKTVHTYMHM
jgi:hypothetical protein